VTLAPPDYVVLALAAGGAVTGVFIGLSGALAFFSGSLAAAFAAMFGWRFFASFVSSGLARGIAAALAALVAFWVVRAIVRKTVKVALAQPGDSIFGALAAGLSGFAVGLGVVWLAQFIGLPGAEGSALLSEVLGYVG
jgi:hypothetical protein